MNKTIKHQGFSCFLRMFYKKLKLLKTFIHLLKFKIDYY